MTKEVSKLQETCGKMPLVIADATIFGGFPVLSCIGELISSAATENIKRKEQERLSCLDKRMDRLERLLLLKDTVRTDNRKISNEAYELFMTILNASLKVAYLKKIEMFCQVADHFIKDNDYYYGNQKTVISIINDMSVAEFQMLKKAFNISLNNRKKELKNHEHLVRETVEQAVWINRLVAYGLLTEIEDQSIPSDDGSIDQFFIGQNWYKITLMGQRVCSTIGESNELTNGEDV